MKLLIVDYYTNKSNVLMKSILDISFDIFSNNVMSLVLEQAERIINIKIIFLNVTTIKYYDKDKKKASDKIACFNLKLYLTKYNLLVTRILSQLRICI